MKAKKKIITHYYHKIRRFLFLKLKLSRWFPESELKNILRCFIYNNFIKTNDDWDVKYKKGQYLLSNRRFHPNKKYLLKFYDPPYGDVISAIQGYFKKDSINRGDIIIDAGAYNGVFTILAAKMTGPRGKVIAFEPDSNNFNKLLKNLEPNNIKNVIAVKRGLWCEKGNLDLIMCGSRSSFIFNTSEDKKVNTVSVDCLDHELKRLKIKKVDFVKMGIEGAEIEAIKGMKNTLKDSNDIKLAIASYHIVDGKKTCYEVEKLLSNLKFNVKSGHPHLTTWANKRYVY